MIRELLTLLFDPSRYFGEFKDRPANRFRTLRIALALGATLSAAELVATRGLLSPAEMLAGMVFGVLIYFILVCMEFWLCLYLPIRWKAGRDARAWEISGLITIPVIVCVFLSIPIGIALPVPNTADSAETSWYGYLSLTLLAVGALWGLGLLRSAIATLAPEKVESTMFAVLFTGATVNLLLRLASTLLGILSVFAQSQPAA